MEEEILSWLNANYETGKETDLITKESLWNDFSNEGDVNLSREQFFERLGQCISRSSFKEIKVTRHKGKRNGYKGLRKKQGHSLAKSECRPSSSCLIERDEEREPEKGAKVTHDVTTKNTSPRCTDQDSNNIVGFEKKDVHSLHCDNNSQGSDKTESGEDRCDENEFSLNAKLKDQQIFSERGESALGKDKAEKDTAPLEDNLEVEDVVSEDQSFANRLTDKEEWSDDKSDSGDEINKSPKSKKLKRSSSSSSSGSVGFGSANSRKQKTKHLSKRRAVFVSSDEEDHSPETFYQNHYRKLKFLLPKHLPNRPKSFRDYLCRVLANPKSESGRRIEIHSHSGDTSNKEYALRRSFIAAAFPPLNVGQLAGGEIEYTFPDDVFPQFTHHGKSEYHCEVCIPFQRWAKTNGVKHSALKSRQVNVDDVYNGTAVLNFSGVVQVHEHFGSKAHQEAVEFFKGHQKETVGKAPEVDKPAKKELPITHFFRPEKPLN